MTKEETHNIQIAGLHVWDEIGWDCLQCLADERRKSIDNVTMPRSHVLEVVLDANRLDTALKNRKQWTPSMGLLSYEEWQRILRPVFLHSRYGI